MNKVFRISSFILSGALIGVVAGKIATSEITKFRRAGITKNVKSVKNMLKSTKQHTDENLDEYFI